MLVSKSMSMSAKCRATEDGVDIMTLAGTLNTNGTVNITRYINNMTEYKANKAQMQADADVFENALYSMGDDENVEGTGHENV